jgi:hypothetical protein
VPADAHNQAARRAVIYLLAPLAIPLVAERASESGRMFMHRRRWADRPLLPPTGQSPVEPALGFPVGRYASKPPGMLASRQTTEASSLQEVGRRPDSCYARGATVISTGDWAVHDVAHAGILRGFWWIVNGRRWPCMGHGVLCW